jgi:hypothetical protein
MATNNASRLLVTVLLLALAGVIGLAIVQYQRLGEAGRRIERLEGRVDGLLAEDGNPRDPGDIATRLDELRAADEALGRRVDALLLRTTANTRRLDSIAAGDLGGLGLDAFVAQKVDETLGKPRPMADNRPELDRVAEYLGLSDHQRRQVADIIDRSKDDVWRMMHERRPDGSDLAGNVTEILNTPMAPDKKLKAMTEGLFQHGPPGSEDSYFTHMMEIRTRALDDFGQTLTDDQRARWKGMGFDLFSIQTGHSPFKQAADELLQGSP